MPRSRYSRRTLLILSVFMSALFLASPALAVPTWRVVPIEPGGTLFWDVSALSNVDAWAVGYSEAGSVAATFVEHWDGANWSVVPSADAGSAINVLLGVTPLSPTDVWAVGAFYPTDTLIGRTLIEHWDGAAWSIVPSPNDGTGDQQLRDVVAISTDDIWAVGTATRCKNCIPRTLAEHWDGATWSVVHTPALTDSGFLSVTATSAGDLWAVGYVGDATLAERWAGGHWHVVASSNTGTGANQLWSVAAVPGTRRVWAVGYGYSNPYFRTLIERWNPKEGQWSIVASPNAGTGDNILYSIAAVSPRKMWAVGSYTDGSTTIPLHERWDGTAWKFVAGPTSSSILHGVTSIPGTNAEWAVGSSIGGAPVLQAVVERGRG